MKRGLIALLTLLALGAGVRSAAAQGGEDARFHTVSIGAVGALSKISNGSASPNGSVVGSPSDLYLQTNGTVWVKLSGTGTNTGWTNFATLGGCSVDGSGNLTCSSVGPTGGVSPVAGTSATLESSNAVAGSGAGGAIGGPVILLAGNAASNSSGGAAGGLVSITAGNGSSIGSATTSGVGGSVTLTAGNGVNNAPGGPVNLVGGTGPSGGGAINLTGGPSGGSNGGGGAVTLTGGAGSAGIGSAGGNITIVSGTASGVTNTGNVSIMSGTPTGLAQPGSITIAVATPANISGGNGIAGNTASLSAGPGGSTSTAGGAIAGNGGSVTLAAGPGGAKTASGASAGNGGNAIISAGLAGVGSGGAASGSPGIIQFKANGITWNWPTADGSSLNFLQTDGSGHLSFAAVSAAFPTETANTVFAGPTSGSAATPTFRALVNADLPITGSLGITIDGAGSAITTGTKGFLYVPSACTITSMTLLSTDASVTSGSIVVDIWKAAYSSYPPTVANTITASDLPTLSSATKAQDSTLTGWTTSVSAGDILAFHVNSASTVSRVTLVLACK